MMLYAADNESIETKRLARRGGGLARKEERMLHRLVDMALGIGTTSGFEGYLAALQRGGKAGAPTADEARKDYQASVGSASISLISFTD